MVWDIHTKPAGFRNCSARPYPCQWRHRVRLLLSDYVHYGTYRATLVEGARAHRGGRGRELRSWIPSPSDLQRNPIRSPFNLAFLTSPNASAARTTGRTFSTALPIAAPPVGNQRSVSRNPPRQQDLTAQHPGRRRHPGMNRPPVRWIGHLGRGCFHGMRGQIFNGATVSYSQ